MPSVHQEVTFATTPDRVFRALMDSTQHAAFTGEAAEIGAEAGQAWSAYGGKIYGRQIEIVENELIVQAWRAGNWGLGVYSVVRFELKSEGDSTRLVLDHTGCPKGEDEHLSGGWHRMYWDKLTAFLAG